ncbi:MAG: S-layer homology domain-containing protein [Clostridia bacterium]|nr:S-layer homology domain-containing protein [Clostridia bacterium]
MKKRILVLLLFALFIVGASSVTMADESESVTAVNGTVTIEATTTAEEGTPVLIFVLPTIDNDEDATAACVAAVTSKSDLDALNVEYIKVVYVDDDGKIEHTCQMSSDLATGVYSVVISYLGSEVYSIGTFEHVSIGDIEILIDNLNGSNAENCGSIIDEDINGTFDTDGVTRLTPKEILRKNSADINYYKNLTDKTIFHKIYYQIKGEEDFTTSTVFTYFNEAAVWTRLKTEEDTLTVLNTYNGTGVGKYWNIAIGEGSDFSNLGDEQSTVLASVKAGEYVANAGEYTANELLEKDFKDFVLMGMFRNLETREALAELIAETDAEGNPNPYAGEFANVRDILDDASLDSYELISVLNSVLTGADDCYTMTDVETLFEKSLPVREEGASNGGNGGSRPMSSGKTSPVLNVEPPSSNSGYNSASFPFRDVAEDYWAKEYIEKLYKKGAINGTAKDTFNASGNIYRQDFIKILVGALGMTVTDSESTFGDVPEDAYYTKFVMTAYENGLIQGMGESFGVGTNIIRQDAAVILSRVLEKYGAEQSGEAADFADEAMISDYAKEAVKIVRTAGIFGGDEQGNFNPKAHLSRAEACAILCRLAERLGEV